MLLKKAGSYHCASMASQMMRAQETMKKQGRAMWRIEDRSPTRSPRSAACLHPYSRDRALSACAKKRVNTAGPPRSRSRSFALSACAPIKEQHVGPQPAAAHHHRALTQDRSAGNTHYYLARAIAINYMYMYIDVRSMLDRYRSVP